MNKIVFDGESEFTMKLKYLSKGDCKWFNKKIKSFGIIIPVFFILLINFDNYLGYKIRGKFPLRHKEWED